MSVKKVKKERMVLLVDPGLKARLQNAAAGHGVTVSAYIAMALSAHMRTVDKLESATNAEALGELMLAMASRVAKEEAK